MIPLPNFLEGICKQPRLFHAVTHWVPLGRTEMPLSSHIWFFTPCYAASPGFCKAQSLFQVVWKSHSPLPPPLFSAHFPPNSAGVIPPIKFSKNLPPERKIFLNLSYTHWISFGDCRRLPACHLCMSLCRRPPTPGTSGFQYNEFFFQNGKIFFPFSSPQLLPADIKNLSIGHKCLQKICVCPKQSRSELIIIACRGSLYGLLHVLSSLQTGQGDIQSFLDMKFIKIA